MGSMRPGLHPQRFRELSPRPLVNRPFLLTTIYNLLPLCTTQRTIITSNANSTSWIEYIKYRTWQAGESHWQGGDGLCAKSKFPDPFIPSHCLGWAALASALRSRLKWCGMAIRKALPRDLQLVECYKSLNPSSGCTVKEGWFPFLPLTLRVKKMSFWLNNSLLYLYLIA